MQEASPSIGWAHVKTIPMVSQPKGSVPKTCFYSSAAFATGSFLGHLSRQRFGDRLHMHFGESLEKAAEKLLPARKRPGCAFYRAPSDRQNGCRAFGFPWKPTNKGTLTKGTAIFFGTCQRVPQLKTRVNCAKRILRS